MTTTNRKSNPEILTELEMAFVAHYNGYGTGASAYHKALAILGRPAVSQATAKANASALLHREPVLRKILAKKEIEDRGQALCCPNCGTALSLTAVGPKPNGHGDAVSKQSEK
jgi:hypothetical protein